MNEVRTGRLCEDLLAPHWDEYRPVLRLSYGRGNPPNRALWLPKDRRMGTLLHEGTGRRRRY
jgi:hypothetical protein